jgi:methionine salvage enolase-phosphatase E1
MSTTGAGPLADVGTLVFDVLGTVVDEAGSVAAETAGELDLLGLDPRRTMMIAAHPWDLRAAAGHGLRTGYIARRDEGIPAPEDQFDVHATDLTDLAAQLIPAR